MAGIGCRRWIENEKKEKIDQQQIAAVDETQTNSFRRRMERWSFFLKKESSLAPVRVENAVSGRKKSKITDTYR